MAGRGLKFLVWLCLGLAAGCGKDGGTSPAVGVPTFADLRIAAGNNQSGLPGTPLAQPLRVQALDTQGRPMGGVRVRFTVTTGAGALADTAAVTNFSGLAETGFRLGPAPGVNRVTATAHGLSGLPPVFTAQAVGEAEGGAPGPAPGGGTSGPVALLAAAADSLLPADGESATVITATVQDSAGSGVPGTVVYFAASAGTVEASERTDAAGRATVTYTTPVNAQGTTVLIEARSGALSAQCTLRVYGVRLSLTASPDTISVDGISRSVVQARLTRAGGTPMPGATVRFETTLGSLSAEAAETDGAGEARVILTAGAEAGRATVTAAYGAGLSEQASVVFEKGPPASLVLVSVEPPSVGVQGAGANETAVVTFEVRDELGHRVGDGEPVLFRLDAPGGGGERVRPERTATVAGRVEAAVSSGTLAHTVRLIAEAPLASGDTIRAMPVPIAIHGGLPDEAHFSLAVKPVNLAGRVLYGLESEVTAYVFDRYSNPVPAGTSVRFRTDGGGVQGAAETNPDGRASVRLFTAAPVPPGPDFLATVTGQTVDGAGREIAATTTVLFSGPTAPIQIQGPEADSLLAGRVFLDEGEFRIVPFTVSDESGNPVMGGSRIQVSSDVAGVTGDVDVVVPDARSGHTQYAVTVADPVPFEDPPRAPRRGTVLIQVHSPNGDRQLTFSITVD